MLLLQDFVLEVITLSGVSLEVLLRSGELANQIYLGRTIGCSVGVKDFVEPDGGFAVGVGFSRNPTAGRSGSCRPRVPSSSPNVVLPWPPAAASKVLPMARAMYSVHRMGRLYVCSHWIRFFELGAGVVIVERDDVRLIQLDLAIGSSFSGVDQSPCQTPLVNGCVGWAARAQANAFGSMAGTNCFLVRRLLSR